MELAKSKIKTTDGKILQTFIPNKLFHFNQNYLIFLQEIKLFLNQAF